MHIFFLIVDKENEKKRITKENQNPKMDFIKK